MTDRRETSRPRPPSSGWRRAASQGTIRTVADLDAQPDTTIPDERAARRLALGIRADPSQAIRITFFGSRPAAEGMQRQVEQFSKQAPADDIEPPDAA